MYYVKKDNPLGPMPAENERDGQYASWEKAVQAWLKKNNWQSADLPTEYDNLHVIENKPNLTILSPQENETIKNMPLSFKVESCAKRGVTRVDYYLDDMFLGSSREAPYAYGHQTDSLTNGIHTLKVISFDDIDNSESAQVNFNLLLNK